MRFTYPLAAFGLLMLTSCANLQEVKTTEPQGQDFQQSLAREYKIFAESEGTQADWVDGEYFAIKSLKAGRGEEVLPEELSGWYLPPASVPELTVARQRLADVLVVDMLKQRYPQPLARTQRLYDCWVEQQEENWQPQDILTCRKEFYENLIALENALKPPPAVAPSIEIERPYAVYFDHDSAKLRPEGIDLIRQFAETLATMDDFVIDLLGNTDRSGTSSYNQTLSQRRSDAVKAELLRIGVPETHIVTHAFGEEHPRIPTPDGVKEQENRRVDLKLTRRQ